MNKGVDPYWGLAGAFSSAGQAEGGSPNVAGHALPVFVFDAPSTKAQILLDRHHQAVAKDGMVLAVQAADRPIATGWMCNGNARMLSVTNLPRSVLGAVLQAGFGVTDTRLTWNPHRDVFEDSLLWSIGHTPFGPFSTSLSLSFPLTDAYARAVLFSQLDSTLRDFRALMSHFEATGESIVEVLPRRSYFSFVEEGKELRHILGSITGAIGVLNFRMALDLIPALSASTARLHEILHQAGRSLDIVLECS